MGCCSLFSSFVYLYSCATCLLIFIYAFDIPCKEKSVGVPCTSDAECYGPNSVCGNGKCSCPLGFEPYDLGENIRICRPAPENIGNACQRECKPPLLCRKFRCECWQGEMVNGTCRVECPEGQEVRGQECQTVAHLNETCESDRNCVDQFTACIDGVCECQKGTIEINNTCVGFCPDGQPTGHSCARLYTNEKDIVAMNMKTDSCPPGHMCMTYGKPLIGHCCKFNCPYGKPDPLRLLPICRK